MQPIHIGKMLIGLVAIGAFGALAASCTSNPIPFGGGGTDGGTSDAGTSDKGCLHGGTVRPVGSSFPSLDGCASCSCEANGKVLCDPAACASGNDAAVDAGRSVDASSALCTLPSAYEFGAIGGLRIAIDRSFLTPPNNYRHTRTPVRGEMPELSCSPALPPCGGDAITALDVERLVRENPDVKGAFAEATPRVYGRDTRPVDGTVLEFKRADGRGLMVGEVCPPTFSSCMPIPAGIAQLAQVLRALDKQQLANPSCKAFAPLP